MEKNKSGPVEPFEICGERKVIFDIESTGDGLRFYIEDELYSDLAGSIVLDVVTIKELRDYLSCYLGDT
jgi:hypothetical protein